MEKADYSSDTEEHSQAEDRKKKEKIEKPLKVKLPKGKHSFSVAGTTFVVDTHYEYIKMIGRGAYGVV